MVSNGKNTPLSNINGVTTSAMAPKKKSSAPLNHPFVALDSRQAARTAIRNLLVLITPLIPVVNTIAVTIKRHAYA